MRLSATRSRTWRIPTEHLKCRAAVQLLFAALVVAACTDGFASGLTDSSRASALAGLPGALGDPLNGASLYSPAFDIPNLDRFPAIVRGSPQYTAGYFIDGNPLVLYDDPSGSRSLSYQEVLPATASKAISTSQKGLPFSPFFFDGYRSWFNGTSELNFSADGSYAPAEYGFFAGPFLSFSQPDEVDSSGHLSLDANTFDATLGSTLSPKRGLFVNGSARIGYNRKGVREEDGSTKTSAANGTPPRA